jgi:3-oxoacyl-[acyl-carrier protein] reductase
VQTLKKETGATVQYVVADVTKPESLEQAVAVAVGDSGQLHALVTNTGGPPVGKVLDFDDQAWRDAFDQVVVSTLGTIRAAVPAMKGAPDASIVCINSYIYRQPAAERGLSNVPRAGVTALVKTLADELAPKIRINNLCPGPIWTGRAKQLLAKLADKAGTSIEEEAQKLISRMLLVDRYGQPEDVAAMTALLLSPRGGFITGATIPVDGGLVRSLV